MGPGLGTCPPGSPFGVWAAGEGPDLSHRGASGRGEGGDADEGLVTGPIGEVRPGLASNLARSALTR